MLLSAYRLALDSILRAFQRAATPLVANADLGAKETAQALFELVSAFRGDAALQANQLLIDSAAELGREAFIPRADVYTAEAIEKVLREARSPVQVVEALSRHVEQGARRQVMAAVPDDPFSRDAPSNVGSVDGGAQVVYPKAWARMLTGADNCPFCVMLASRGAVYSSRTRAGSDVYRFHNNCDCVVVPVFDLDNWVGKSTADYLYGIWRENGSLKSLSNYLKENSLSVPDMRAGLAA
ncbi:hypothetical protein [uncultured Rothia sp.]|uniref:VG15 protein n=1 Tax=uncultured Rothia sp. TaxID=316088 RepID=UPI003216F430